MNLSLPCAPPVLFGLGAAAVWGTSDFTGGLATRHARPGLVVLAAHGVSLVLLCSLGALLHAPALSRGDTLEALLSGVTGGLGLMFFYEALASGVMGLTAALAGLVTAVLPVTVAIMSQGWPGASRLFGFLVAGAAILLIASGQVHGARRPGGRALMLAVLAGAGFGLQLVLLHGAGGTSLVRALTFSRVGGTAVALAAVALGRPSAREKPAPRTLWRFALLASLAGLLDTLGNLLYLVASLTGRLDVAAVLSSLYPAGTILLAAWLLKERTTRLQAAGMALALAAVVLISL